MLPELRVPHVFRQPLKQLVLEASTVVSWRSTIFFQLVSARYERSSIILTSNKSYGEWGTIFGDPIIATAILDRLLHHSTTVNIRGESYRLKERKKAGLLPTAPEPLKPAQADRVVRAEKPGR